MEKLPIMIKKSRPKDAVWLEKFYGGFMKMFFDLYEDRPSIDPIRSIERRTIREYLEVEWKVTAPATIDEWYSIIHSFDLGYQDYINGLRGTT